MTTRCFQVNNQEPDDLSHSMAPRPYFDVSIEQYQNDAPSLQRKDYDYVTIVPLSSYYRYHFGNGGSQGYRHKTTGWTFPDFCRQQGGCPEMWNKTHKKNLTIQDDSPVLDYLAIW